MKKTSWILVLVGLTLVALVATVFPFQSAVLAAPNPQLTNFPTPTPGSDGRIIYIVQDGDTLWRIAAVSGLNIADLRDLNNLGGGGYSIPRAADLLRIGGTSCPAVDFSPGCNTGVS